MIEEESISPIVLRLLASLADASAPCGPDLEYDNDFLALQQAAAGKPETQFDAGLPPDWRAVREQAEALLARSKDLRIGVLWLRAMLYLQGFAALTQGLQLVHGLIDTFWDALHPLPDDGDLYARAGALAVLVDPEGLLGDLRQAQVFNLRGVGEVRVRSVEIALGLLQPKSDETPFTRDRLQQMFADAALQEPALRPSLAGALDRTRELTALVEARFDDQDSPDLKPLLALLKAVAGMLPAEAVPVGAGAGAEGAQPADAPGAAVGAARLAGGVHSRDDALRAIDMVCEFLERTEPTSPAPLLLRRARRMINRNFLQLLKDLAPDALSEVARVMGVDPETVTLDDST